MANKSTLTRFETYLATAMVAMAIAMGLPQQTAQADDVLLYASFDNGVQPEIARGEPRPSFEVRPEFGKGVRGRALLVGGKPSDTERASEDQGIQRPPARNVCYQADGNIDLQQGTISFWVKPVDWSGETSGFNVLMRTAAGRGHFMVYKFFSKERLLFLRGEQEEWTQVVHRIGHWKPGQWRHFAITWSEVEMRLFIDGAMVCSRRVRYPTEEPRPTEPISIGPGGSWEHAFIGHSLIDEFRIHGRPLSHEQIMALYRQDAAGLQMDSGHITVGRVAPRLDGKIDDFEYAFGGTGFSDLHGMVSVKQCRYFFSYDDDCLYFAATSPLGLAAVEQSSRPADAAISGNRFELLLVPKELGDALRHLVFTPGGAGFELHTEKQLARLATVQIESTVSDDGWTLEAAIPWTVFGATTAPDGREWRFNVGRAFAQPAETISVAPVVGRLDDRSKFMGLRFEADAPLIQIAGLFDLIGHRAAYDLNVRANEPTAEIAYVSISDTTGPYGLRLFERPLYAEGHSRPLRAPAPPRPGWLLPDFALHEARIVAQGVGEEELLYRARFIYERQTPMKTYFLYTLDRRQLAVTAQRKADGNIRARFLHPDGSVAWQAEKPIPADATIFEARFDLDFDKILPGEYNVKIDYVSPEGEATETYEQAYRLPGPDSPAFRKYVDPEAEQVPAPWAPLEFDGRRVAVWGRRYDFSGGFLVSSLESQGHEVLAAPAVLRLNGKALALESPARMEPSDASDTRVALRKESRLGPLDASCEIAVDFDGYCDVAMTLRPTHTTPAVETLSLDFPLLAAIAELVRDNRININTGTKTGAVGEYWCQRLVDEPFLWVGNEKAGFNWVAPTLENWHCRVHPKNVEIIRHGDTAILRFNLVDTPLTIQKPRTIRFGFILTPSRPLDPAINRGRIERDWQMWCQPWRYFAFPDYDTADRRAIERCAAGVDEVFLYLGDQFMSPFSPDWSFFEQEWRESRPSRTYGEWTNGDITGPMRGRLGYTEACIMSETFRNFVNNTRAEFFRKAKTPLTPKAVNYYFDTGVRTSLCRNARHGCKRWEALDGNLYGRIPIRERREIALNVYRMIRRTGPRAKIMSHQGWTRCMPLQHFTDIIIGGEGIGSLVSNAGNYYDVLTPELFRATFSPYAYGVKMVFLNMIIRSMREGHPQKMLNFDLEDPTIRRALLHSYGYCVVHDVGIYDAADESRPLREQVWQAQDSIGWNTDVVFHPYWAAQAVRGGRPGSDRILASAYTNQGKMLLAVLNDTDESAEVVLALDMKELGVAPGSASHDVFDPETTAKLNQNVSIEMPARGFRLFVTEGE